MKFSSLSAVPRLVALAVVPLAASSCANEVAEPSPTTAVAATDEPTRADSPDGSTVVYTVDLPDGVESGSPAAAAWEALMGTDGEYASYATYGAVIDRYGDVEPYVTIQTQEGHHIDALTRQLDRLGVAVPQNPYLGQLDAPDSLQDAAANWAAGEVANVAMYDSLMADATGDALTDALTRVFTNLRRSSQESHLPMFTEAAANGGTLDEAAMADFDAQHDAMEGDMEGDMDHDS